MKINAKLAILFLLLSIFLISGQQGCPSGTTNTGGTGGTTPSTSAQKSGVDFSFVQGLDYLYSGKKLVQDQTFYVKVNVENSDKAPKSITLCLQDNIEDMYSGLRKECQTLMVKGAVYDSNNKLIEIGSYPATFGEFKYSSLPISQDITLYATATYADQSSASGQANIPLPESESISITQSPSPLTVKVQKDVSPREEGYKVTLGIDLSNTNSGVSITTPDFNKPGLIIDPKLSAQQLDCEYSDIPTKYVQFDADRNTKFIRCSALLPKETIAYPFVMQMYYGVKLTKQFTFRVEKQAQMQPQGAV